MSLIVIMLQLTCPNNTELNTLPPPHYWNINEVNTASMLNVTPGYHCLTASGVVTPTKAGGWVHVVSYNDLKGLPLVIRNYI